MLVAADMADSIRSSMGFPTPVSAQLMGWASGIISELMQAKVNNAPGTITGVTLPGGSLSAGAGMSGMISSMVASRMASSVQSGAGYPSISAELSAFCAQIVSHIESGMVVFSAGNITGTCTSSPVSPGPLVAGAGSNGQVTGLSGSALASMIHSAVGYPGSVSTQLTSFCTAITNYIMANAQVAYSSGTVTGTCPPGGGPLAAGAGANGTIS